MKANISSKQIGAARKLIVEILEDRQVLAAFGLPAGGVLGPVSSGALPALLRVASVATPNSAAVSKSVADLNAAVKTNTTSEIVANTSVVETLPTRGNGVAKLGSMFRDEFETVQNTGGKSDLSLGHGIRLDFGMVSHSEVKLSTAVDIASRGLFGGLFATPLTLVEFHTSLVFIPMLIPIVVTVDTTAGLGGDSVAQANMGLGMPQAPEAAAVSTSIVVGPAASPTSGGAAQMNLVASGVAVPPIVALRPVTSSAGAAGVTGSFLGLIHANNAVTSAAPTVTPSVPAGSGSPVIVNNPSTPTPIPPPTDPGITGGGTLVVPETTNGSDFRILLPLTGSVLRAENAVAEGTVLPVAPSGPETTPPPTPSGEYGRVDGSAATLQPQTDDSAVAPPVAEGSLGAALADFLSLVTQSRSPDGQWLFSLGFVQWLMAGAVGAAVLETARRKYRRVAADPLFAELASDPTSRRSFPRLRFTCLSGGA